MKKICRWMLAFCLAFALGTLAASAADTVYVKDGEFFAKTVIDNEIKIDKLIVLAPVFASNERKAEGVVAQASEVVGFRPILVETH